MESYRIGQAAEMLGVSTDTVRRWIDGGKLPATRTAGGQRAIEGGALAAFARSMAPPQPLPGRSSARNRFAGIVIAVKRDKVMAQIDLVAGPHRVVSLMSREAADELGLQPGMRAIASVKATNVVVETVAG